jgi:hypothetical protein
MPSIDLNMEIDRLCRKYFATEPTKVGSKTRGSCIPAAVGNLWHEKDLLFRLSLA